MSSRPTSVFGPDLREALVAMVRRRVPESEVEDIVQATLADALASPHAPGDSDTLRRWIFGVAKNKVVDYHRRAGRETFDIPEVSGRPGPHAEADLLRWAERNLPPGDDSRTTLDWMLREGEGEKLEWIAESARVPAPRVRQRVSRLRRHFKEHWKKEVALLAALGVLSAALLFLWRPRPAEDPIARPITPHPITNEDVARAAELRQRGLERCNARDWNACVRVLDEAKRLDPAGDGSPEVQRARRARDEAVRDDTQQLPPSPSDAPSPDPTAPPLSSPPPVPTPTADGSGFVPSVTKSARPKPSGKPVPSGEGPRSESKSAAPTAPPKGPATPAKMQGKPKAAPKSFDSDGAWDPSTSK